LRALVTQDQWIALDRLHRRIEQQLREHPCARRQAVPSSNATRPVTSWVPR
jgi:hypothetical protein